MISRAVRRNVRDLVSDAGAIFRGSLFAMSVVFLCGFGEVRNAWLVVNLLLVIPLTFTAVALHEAAHALGALAVGVRPFRIVMGTGRTVFETRVGTCRVDVHAVPLGGRTMIGTNAARWVRARFWLMVAAGPVFSLLLAWVLGSNVHDDLKFISFTFAPWSVGWLVVLITLPGSVLPLKLKSAFGDLETDAWVLITLPFWGRERIDALRVAFQLHEASEHQHERRFPEAIACCDRALERVPESYSARLTRASLLLLQGDFERGREETLSLLSRTTSRPILRLAALNNVAWANLMLDVPELLAETVKFSGEVIAAHPRFAPFMGTRGLALIELGEFAEGIGMLERAFRTNLEAEHRALNACGVAIGLVRSGKREEAGDWLERARELDPQCLLLPRSAAEVEGEPRPLKPGARKLAKSLARERKAATRRASRKARSRSPYWGPVLLVVTLALVRYLLE